VKPQARLLVGAVALLLNDGPVAAERGDFEFAPNGWPLLLRIAGQVPGFAGPTSDGLKVVPALTDLSKIDLLKAYLREDLYGQKFWGVNSSTSLKVVKAQYSVIQLVAAAEAILNVRPSTSPRVDTMLNRVVLDSSILEADAAALAQQAGVSGLVISARERPRLHATIYPSTLSLKALRAAPRGEVSLGVKLVNIMNRPAMYAAGCGAEVDLEALTLNGEQVAGVTYGCTLARPLIGTVFQAGESRTFRTVPHADLRGLAPGHYLWHVLLTDEKIPFTLTP
jgi:hypothetical protein